jgi:hypothetical protein
MHLQELELLSADECDRVRNQIHDLRSEWISRRPDVPFFTLGAASYLDAADEGFEVYKKRLVETNPVLEQHFAWLYDRFAEGMTEHLGQQLIYDESLALPGFHIFLAHQEFTKPMASMHYDLQFESIDWSEIGEVDKSRHLSMTLTITLPADGGGLWVWNVNNLELAELDIDGRRELLRENRKAEYHSYSVGRVALHSGHQLHQIAPTRKMVEGDERITLQAHALPVNGQWLCYW